MRHGSAAALALVTVALAASCGGDGGGEDFPQAANDACDRYRSEVQTLQRALERSLTTGAPRAADVRRRYTELLTAFRRQLDALEEVEAPEDQSEAYDEWLATVREAVDLLERNVSTFASFASVRSELAFIQRLGQMRVGEVARLGQRYESMGRLAREMRRLGVQRVSQLPAAVQTRLVDPVVTEATAPLRRYQPRIDQFSRRSSELGRESDRRARELGLDRCLSTSN